VTGKIKTKTPRYIIARYTINAVVPPEYGALVEKKE